MGKTITQIQLCLFASLFLFVLSAQVNAQGRQRTYTVSPSGVEAGQEYELLIKSAVCSSNDLIGTDLNTSADKGVTVLIATGTNDCRMFARVFVAEDAPAGAVPLRIIKDGGVWGSVDLTVTRPPGSPPLPKSPAAAPRSPLDPFITPRIEEKR